MEHNWVSTVLSEKAVSGAAVQLVESRYCSGARAHHRSASVMLRWRLWPDRVRVQMWEPRADPEMVGRMMLIPSETETDALALNDEEGTRSVSLLLHPQWLDHITQTPCSERIRHAGSLGNLRDSDIESAMRRISSEILSPSPCSALIIEAASMFVAARLAGDMGGEERGRHQDMLSTKRVEEIEEFVINHPTGSPSLAEIADQVGVSANYVRQLYKNATGQKLFSFVEATRIRRAQQLLRESDMPLKVIAHSLDFCTPSAFCHAFRKATGTTPGHYRLTGKFH